MKLKINSLSREVLTDREQNRITGGSVSARSSSASAIGDLCLCGCIGASSNHDNGCANKKGGLQSPGGGTAYP